MTLQLLFLGTGTSAGVPMIGCECEVCYSKDPRDRRDRPSVLVSYPDPTAPQLGRSRRLLIDAAPELRSQMLRHHIHAIDGVLFTHAHADHIFGMDDLRRFNMVMKTPMPIYAEASVLKRFREMFSYIFNASLNVNSSVVPQLTPHAVEAGEPLELFGAMWTPLRLMHGRLPILGFRVDCAGRSLAYCTDVSGFAPQTYPLLCDLDVLVIDALRYRHHPTHLTVNQALEQIEHIAPKRAYLTHIAHEISHADLADQLPQGVMLAYDDLRVTCGGNEEVPGITAPEL